MTRVAEQDAVIVSTGRAKRIIKKTILKDPTTVIFMTGGPGVGKSAICRQVAEEIKYGYKETFLLTRNPVDFAVPFPDESKKFLKLLPLRSALPREEVDGKKGLWLLDEISSAPLAVQVVAQRIVWDRRLEEEKVPDGWSIVAAGNRITDKGLVYQLPSPLAGRFTRIDIQPDLDDWVESFAMPRHISHEVIACLRMNADMLYKFDPAKYQGGAFPSPRGWEKVDRKMKNIGWVDEDFYTLAAGDVGMEGAGKLMAFLRVYDKLPKPEDVINGKVIMDETEDRSLLFALAGTVVNYVVQSKKKDIMKLFLKNAVIPAPATFAVIMMKDVISAGMKPMLVEKDILPSVHEVVKKFGKFLDL